MQDVQDVNSDQGASVHDDVVGMADKLMRACNPASAVLNMGFPKQLSIITQLIVELVGRLGVSVCNVLSDATEIVQGAVKPNDGQYV